jgi:serine/threonine protein phosphatase 1
MSETYVMTDIHGRLAMLKALLAQVPEGSKLVFLGDYVDRGSESREVVALIRSLPNATCLRGNHEDMLCAHDPRMWLSNGGASTLMSYRHPLTGSVDWEAMDSDKEWFLSLPRIHSDAHRVYVHAGVLPMEHLDRQPESVTQWLRYDPRDRDIGWRDKHVVHGHTPGLLSLVHRTCLDGGMSQMCCGVFDDDLPGGPVRMLWS